MDSKLSLDFAPFRDARYAPVELEVEKGPGGALRLTNPTPVDDRFLTLTAPLQHWAGAAPDRIWLAERSGPGWRTITYREGWERVRALAGGLKAMGLEPGRPLLILARNGIDHALMRYAAAGQAIATAPVSPQYGLPGAILSRLAHAVELLQPAAVFTEDAALFADGLGAPCLAGLPVVAAANPRAGDLDLDALAALGPAADAVARPDDHAQYLLTSGSTGHPKAVIFLHRGIALNSAQITGCFDDPEPPVMLDGAPWSHSMGANSILHMVTQRGGTLHVDGGQPTAARFGLTLENLAMISPTVQNMVPAGWALFAEALEQDEALARSFFARVRQLQYGGSALGQAVADRVQAVAVRTTGERISFSSGFGSTETGPRASQVFWPNDRTGLVGLPIPGTSIKLVPEDGKLEVRVKGPQVTPGYLRRPDLTAAAFDEEGYYRMGDAARLFDPNDVYKGLAFDGRLAENFKLASGTFVNVGEVRVAAVGAIGGAVTDAVVCGEDEAVLGLLFYPNPTLDRTVIARAVRAGLERFNARAKGQGGRIARALVLPDAPDPSAGEITDKGYISQSLARRRRAAEAQRLYADPPDPDVMVF